MTNDKDEERAREIVAEINKVVDWTDEDAEPNTVYMIAAALRAVRSEERAASADLRAVAEAARRHADSTRDHFSRECGHTRCRSCTETQESLDAALSKLAAGAGGGG